MERYGLFDNFEHATTWLLAFILNIIISCNCINAKTLTMQVFHYIAIQLICSSNELWMTAPVCLFSPCWQWMFKSTSWCSLFHSQLLSSKEYNYYNSHSQFNVAQCTNSNYVCHPWSRESWYTCTAGWQFVILVTQTNHIFPYIWVILLIIKDRHLLSTLCCSIVVFF